MMNKAEIKFHIKRHDQTQDRSLKAWSAADEYLLQACTELGEESLNVALYNDRFGFLATHLHARQPIVVIVDKSQERAIVANFRHIHKAAPEFCNPFHTLSKPIDLAVMKVPKSLDLFQLYLGHITHNSSDDLKVICSFMTRHFSPRLLDIAREYFKVAEQSRAYKKARLLTLTGKKDTPEKEIITEVTYKDRRYKQFAGVFSADHVDYGTQFFLDHVEIAESDHCVMDLGSGNGIIGNELLKARPNAEMHFVDNSILAVASAKLNVQGVNIHYHWSDDLSEFDENYFDLIVTNPPFHFEYETNIYVSIEMFKGCQRCLKDDGNLQLVANRHLNYKTHLDRLFGSVEVVSESEKYVIYKCVKQPA